VACLCRLNAQEKVDTGDSDSLFTGIDAMMQGLSKSGSMKFERSAHTMSRYEIPSEDTDLATIFETIENNQEELEIVDFSVSQTTLEDGARRC
jgi:hypothetical protein